MENLIYDLWLSNIEGVGSKTILKLIKTFGNSQNVYTASEKELKEAIAKMKKVPQTTADNIIKNKKLSEAEKQFLVIEKEKISIILITDKKYPKLLKEIYDPPFVLYYKGDLPENNDLTFGIVGSRKATAYGKWAAYGIAAKLSEYNVTVISGMAYGIDAFAHKGALESGGRTVAVLGCGVDKCYPPSNQQLMEKIIENGAVISEYGPGTAPFHANFPRRNRIISGLSKGIIIVEAGVKSGSLITAEFALEQGRDVYAVPGNINSIYSKGTNKLIKEGAVPLTAIDEIIDELYINKEPDKPMVNDLGKDEKMVYDCIVENKPANLDMIAYLLCKDVAEINAIMTILEIKGLIEILPGKIIIAK